MPEQEPCGSGEEPVASCCRHDNTCTPPAKETVRCPIRILRHAPHLPRCSILQYSYRLSTKTADWNCPLGCPEVQVLGC